MLLHNVFVSHLSKSTALSYISYVPALIFRVIVAHCNFRPGVKGRLKKMMEEPREMMIKMVKSLISSSGQQCPLREDLVTRITRIINNEISY